MQPRKTLYTKNDQWLGHREYTAPRDRYENLKARVILRFKLMLEDMGFTTHIGVVEEFMNADYVDGEAIFSFARQPEFGDHIELRGGPSDGIKARYAGKDKLEALHYPSQYAPGTDIRPERHYYTLHGLDVATGRWIYRHEG